MWDLVISDTLADYQNFKLNFDMLPSMTSPLSLVCQESLIRVT